MGSLTRSRAAMEQVWRFPHMRRGADFFILVLLVVLGGAFLDWGSVRGLRAAALQADSFRPLDVVGLDGAAGLCSGLRTGHPNFFRQRMAAFVRGRLWSSSATGTQEECESPSLLQIMAERSLLGCLLGLALLMASLFLPRSQLAELPPGKWLLQLRGMLLSAWDKRRAEQRKHSATLALRVALRSGDKELLSTALEEAEAAEVEALEKERERQREEKRQTRSREAAERSAAAAQEKAADEVVNAADKAAKADKAADAHTPKASFRGNSFFGRKATPVGTASPAGSGAGGDREWRWAGAKKEKPVAVPIEPVTPRPARRGASVVLTVPRPQANGGNRAASNAKGEVGKKQQGAPGTPVSPAAAAAPGWTKKFSRHTSSAPTTPNGKYGPPDGVASTLPAGQGIIAASLLGQPPEPPPPPAQAPRLYAQVARDGSGGQQERPSTAPPSGKRTPPPPAPASPHAPQQNGSLFPPAFPPSSLTPTQHQPSSLFLGLGGFAGFLGGQAPPQSSAAEALSPFPGMSLHRRVPPAVRTPAAQGALDLGPPVRGLPSYTAMSMAPQPAPYHNFDSIWSSAGAGGEPLPIGTSPPGWNPMGMRCRTSAAPDWKPTPGPGLSPLQFASEPLPPLEATLADSAPAAAATTAPVTTGLLSEGSVSGPSMSHFSSVSTSSSLEGW
ncbi:hypothetical protein WJX75_004122 [Coccomyxa subellipsoidea]|uniref:Transmembrane protein n=1 Tax=Coccomyxa subellipsoidea TaxID=248742 RepID=A0ABR2YC69_9CHLO